MSTVATRAAVASRLPPSLARFGRFWSATLAVCDIVADAFTEARAMQRAAYRRYPFTDH